MLATGEHVSNYVGACAVTGIHVGIPRSHQSNENILLLAAKTGQLFPIRNSVSLYLRGYKYKHTAGWAPTPARPPPTPHPWAIK